MGNRKNKNFKKYNFIRIFFFLSLFPETFKSLHTELPSDSSRPQIPVGLSLLNTCLQELKLVTRRYSKKQIKWVNNRFLASKDRQVPALYALDTSEVENWNEKVLQPAISVVDSYQRNAVSEIEPLAKRSHPGEGLNEEVGILVH